MFSLFFYAFSRGREGCRHSERTTASARTHIQTCGIRSSNERGEVTDGWMHLIIKQSPIIEPGMRMVLEPDKTRSCCQATGMTINLELGGGDDGNRSENVILNR